MENLEDIDNMTECQTACQYLTNCTFFVYDSTEKVCKANTNVENRVCDIIHGMAEPNLKTCLDNDKLPWARTSGILSTQCILYTYIYGIIMKHYIDKQTFLLQSIVEV